MFWLMATHFGLDGFPATSKLQQPEKQTAYAQQFDWLCRSWAIAGIFHFMTFHDWRWQGLSGLILICLAMAVLLRPKPALFALFLAVDVFAVGSHTGPIPNHILFSLVMNIVMLGVLIVGLVREKLHATADDARSRWVITVAPIMRMAVSILYFFTVFHKINTAYFNPDVSCASTMLHEIGLMYPLMPTGGVFDQFAIYGTLLIEAFIPILMLIPRTRLVGGVLALGFHAMLSLHPFPGIYSFTATIVSLLSWFVPAGFFTTFRPTAVARKVLMAIWFLCCGVVAMALLIGCVPALRGNLPTAGSIGFGIGYYGLLIYAVAISVVYVQHAWRHPKDLTGFIASPDSLTQRLWLACPLCVILTLIGIQPYLGLRTRMCFSMFSNLQTEGGVGNHLLVPASMQQTRWQQELVSVSTSTDPGIAKIAEHQHRIPILELARRIRESRAGYVTVFTFQNKSFKCVSGDDASLKVLPDLNAFQRRYLYFRSVGPDPSTVPCQW